MKSKYFRYFFVILAAAFIFSLSYNIGVHAGSIFGRCYNGYQDGCGYFKGGLGACPASPRDDVMPGGIGSGGINTAQQFIDAVEVPLRTGDQQHRTGAAFIIDTMIGAPGNQSNPPSAAEVTDFENRVNYASQLGHIKYNQAFTYTLNSCYQGNNNPAQNDDMFWDTSVCEGQNPCGRWQGFGLIFLNTNGAVAYEVNLSCANPVGTVSPLPAAPTYTITGNTTVSSPTVVPGQQVTFSDFLSNSGPSSAQVNWTTQNPQGGANASGSNFIVGGANNIRVHTDVFNVPLGAGNGTRYCSFISFNPQSNGQGSGTGATVCTTVVYNYSLTPTVTVSPGNVAQQGDTLTFTYSYTNNGPTYSLPTTCKAEGATHGPNYTPQGVINSDRGDLAIGGLVYSNCNTSIAPNTSVKVATETYTIVAINIGDSICRTLVLNPKSQAGGVISSAESCVVIAKAPYVQFMGNDVWTGGGFQASGGCTNNSAEIATVSRQLGPNSWGGSEAGYAAFALGKIVNFGTADKALAQPVGPTGTQLTFSNANFANLGNFGSGAHCLADYIPQFTKVNKDPNPGTVNLGAQASSVQKDFTPGNVTFTGGTLQPGVQLVYLVHGDVIISGDINYPALYTKLSDIPSLVLLADYGDDISVDTNVHQIFGIFEATDDFNSCNVPWNRAVQANTPPCEQQLTINGPLIASNVQLMRTYGADNTNGTSKVAAEQFEFPPEVYLRSALSAGSSNTIQTVSQQDLPPRF